MPANRPGYYKEWYHRPENKERRALQAAGPERKAYMKAWRARNPRPYDKEREALRRARPEYKARAKAWRTLNAARNRDLQLRKNFGLTISEYNSMFLAQGGVCAICQSPPGRIALAVDHDHSTGANRALLCAPCNQGMGRIDNIDRWAEKAMAYKARYSETEAKEQV